MGLPCEGVEAVWPLFFTVALESVGAAKLTLCCDLTWSCRCFSIVVVRTFLGICRVHFCPELGTQLGNLQEGAQHSRGVHAQGTPVKVARMQASTDFSFPENHPVAGRWGQWSKLDLPSRGQGTSLTLGFVFESPDCRWPWGSRGHMLLWAPGPWEERAGNLGVCV